MIFNVPICGFSDTIADVRERIFNEAGNFDSLSYIYVLDNGKRLKGVFSIKEIFIREDKMKVEEIMDRKVVRVGPEDDQERAAVLAIKYNIKAIPVTDDNHFFLGVVTSDSILDILRQEHMEDMFLSAGIHKEDNVLVKTLSSPIGVMAKIRLPWLIVGLFGGVLAAQIIRIFESPLSQHFILAAFIPLVVYMADAVASQTQMLYIRNLAMRSFSSKKYFIKEIKTGILIAMVIAAVLFVMTFIISGEVLMAMILSISIFFTVMTAITVGLFIAWILFKSGKDPAMGAGPFGTIAADISSLIIYFVIVSVSLNIWGV